MVLFTISVPNKLTALFTYAFLLTMWILFHNYYQLTLPVFTMNLRSLHAVLFTYAFLNTMWYFSAITTQFTLQQCLQHILNIYIQYCLQLLSPVYLLAVYICFLFTIWYFFTITAQFTLQQYLQIILNINIQYCLQLLSPVYLLCCLHMLSFSQCEYFPHITVQLSIWQCLHWIFNVTYCIVYNYSSQYTNFAVYICFLFTIWYFFTITAQFTLQLCLQHILNI